MKILIISYGSIGKRHAKNLKTLGHNVILLRHSAKNPNIDGIKEYYSFEEVNDNEEIDGAIVCSPTSKHLDDVKLLTQHKIPFLLEKPPTADLKSMLVMGKLLHDVGFTNFDIGFNLRYYPVLQFIKDFLPNLGKVYSSQIYAGYYLPSWRKNVDYRETCSAKKELGGGVHIELVHELDYILWFYGLPEKVVAYVNKISALEISTEDICIALLTYPNGAVVELHLDYLSQKLLRGCRIIAEKGMLEWTIQTGVVNYSKKNKEKTEEIFSLGSNYDFNTTYIEEVKHFLEIISGSSSSKGPLSNAIHVMKVLEAIKLSSKHNKWIYLTDIDKLITRENLLIRKPM